MRKTKLQLGKDLVHFFEIGFTIPNAKISDRSKFKAFADDKINNVFKVLPIQKSGLCGKELICL